ncbi:DUF5707 domain-containing protein [Streptomyces chiangmaiensis]|uniref:DUF5707 domain-containing protein n=1 Tax=Streptomyces chiangmaiensis TaxID=766497 RepID=A0ABU7FUZ3_9ACTN|nr:DUF5707 domain-containing protein [Streptomyces chiangmaiensis]MED7827692.1 DUF5707 domain-containing protein [Streptomyces chiangmaiensis]
MRICSTVAAVTGALALAALAVPAAQADQVTNNLDRPSVIKRFSATADSSTLSATAVPTITNVTVNGGKDIVLGTTYAKTITVSLTASHESGIQDAIIFLWHGTDAAHSDGSLPPNKYGATWATCTASSATTSTCKLTITIDPQRDLYKNSLAGTWHVGAFALAGDSSHYYNEYYGTHRVQRYSKLTVNASPEPVVKGKSITVTGKLTRANWETHDYRGYTNQPVKLQFRKAGTTTYSTIKTVYTDSYGNLKTTVTASADGYWRWNFAGSSTTPSVTATGDYVDVQ